MKNIYHFSNTINYRGNSAPSFVISTSLFKSLVFSIAFLIVGVGNVFGQAQSSTFSTAGTQYWLCPTGVTSITVKCYGGGGGGGRRNGIGVTGGGGGLRAAATSTTYAPASSGVATNSVLPFGVFTAQAPGNIGTNGGANTFKGWAGVGEVRNASENGNVGFTGGGGSGGCETGGVGGAGGDGYLLIIEYY